MPGIKPLLEYSVTYDELVSCRYTEDKELDDLSILGKLPFMVYPKEANVTKYMNKIIGEHSVSNYTLHNVRHGGVHYNFMREGLGALMTTTLIVRTHPIDRDKLAFFIPKGDQGKRPIYIARPSDAPLTYAAKNFIALAKEMCDSGEIFKSLS